MLRSFAFTKAGLQADCGTKEVVKYLKTKSNVIWIDIEEPSETEIDFLIDEFEFHPLSIEDAIFPQDHPKVEEFDEYVFMILYAISYSGTVNPHQLNIFFGDNYVITVHDDKLNAINRFANKITRMAETNNGKNKNNPFAKGADMVLHSIIDNLVDEYFPSIDRMEDKIAQLEDRVLEEKESSIMEDLLSEKRNILVMRKFIYLEKQALSRIMRAEGEYIKEGTRVYFRDIFDHLVSMQETLEILREVIPSLIESYLSMASKKLNQLIHRLTILATIAIPMTIITSYYGMNLKLPEFEWGIWGYLFMLVILVGSSLLTFFVLKKNKWL